MMLSTSLLRTTDRYIAKLTEAGVRTVEDFVTLYPREHKDKANVITAFAQVNLKEPNTVRATLESMATERTRFGKQLVKAVIRDAHNTLAEAVWFNQPYLARQYHAGDEVVLYGKAKYGYGKLSFVSPDLTLAADASAIEPVYSDTNTVPGHWIGSKMPLLRAHMRDLPDLVPEAIRAKRWFPSRARALDMIHFPESAEDIEAARRALAYEELYLIQAEHAKKRDLHTELTAGRTTSIPLDAERVKTILGYFPYELTDKQKIVTYQILRDMERDTAMYRLLQGDVGTGKTAVAFVTAIHAILGSGGQVAVLAPTEILARQHFAGFEAFGFATGIRSDLLVGGLSAGEKKSAKARLKAGETGIIFGTHALLEEDVLFENLVYTIIDEQHRFGVEQRKILEDNFMSRKSDRYPHVLSMTATPIPRTLAITLYGSQDLSILNEYPKGRKPIHTAIIREKDRETAYRFIDTELAAGRQAYWISPLVEESEKLAVASAASTAENLRAIFPHRRVELLHGKMPAREKNLILDKFVAKEIDILSSTSVVEVGVNNPNATIMCIEGAERFGLSQLHQFRGRVGRGSDASYCYLLPTEWQATERLRAIERTQDWFELSEIDMELRGPGEVYGVRQSGLPELKIASFQDLELVEDIREDLRAPSSESQKKLTT